MSEMGERLRKVRIAAGYDSAMKAAKRFGWATSTYAAHENGQNKFDDVWAKVYAKAFKTSAAWLLTEESTQAPSSRVPLMGFIGAAAEVEPDFEQVPPVGLETIELPFTVPEGIIAFKVSGDSMYQFYDDGDVVLCWKDRRSSFKELSGKLAVVRAVGGKRYLRVVTYTAPPTTATLTSPHAPPMHGVKVEWIGEVFVARLPASQLERAEATEPLARPRSAARRPA